MYLDYLEADTKYEPTYHAYVCHHLSKGMGYPLKDEAWKNSKKKSEEDSDKYYI